MSIKLERESRGAQQGSKDSAPRARTGLARREPDLTAFYSIKAASVIDDGL